MAVIVTAMLRVLQYGDDKGIGTLRVLEAAIATVYFTMSKSKTV